MDKRVQLNGIEVYLAADAVPQRKILDFVQDVLTSVEAGLTAGEIERGLKIHFRFLPAPGPGLKHRIHMNGIGTRESKEKVVRILRRSLAGFQKNGGKIRVELVLQNTKRRK